MRVKQMPKKELFFSSSPVFFCHPTVRYFIITIIPERMKEELHSWQPV